LQLCSQFGRFLLCQPKRRAAVETTGFRHHFKNNGVPAPDNLGGLSPFHAADFDRQFNLQQAASVGGLFQFARGPFLNVLNSGLIATAAGTSCPLVRVFVPVGLHLLSLAERESDKGAQQRKYPKRDEPMRNDHRDRPAP
jgi:hypothetical protein